MSVEFLGSLLGGGIVAAVVTALFNVWWDARKQRIVERWERRKFDANSQLRLLFGLTEIFYSTKTELFFVVFEVDSLHLAFGEIERQVSKILREKTPSLSVADFEVVKNQALASHQQWTAQAEVVRWNQYNTTVKNLRARAEAALNVGEHLLSTPGLHARMVTMFNQLATTLDQGVEGARRRLQELEAREPDFKDIQRLIRDEFEVTLGKTRDSK